jgi:YidC/Oxa1 family membrane protein insertase
MLDPVIHFLGSILATAYELIPNLGLAIVLLTIIANLAVLPLTLKQVRSMAALQEIQPRLKDLQREHKDDRSKLNEETVALYKEKGVNPASGCLPMLVQLPIWWSLFRLLRSFRAVGGLDPTRYLPQGSKLSAAILGGHTTFLPGMNLVTSPREAVANGIGGAIPYLIVVAIIIIGGSYQQRQTTQRRQPDRGESLTPPQQQMQKLTKVMPVLFGFISYGLLLGVDLYIASGQVVRISQQAWIARRDQASGE